jgi:hypothetical protein
VAGEAPVALKQPDLALSVDWMDQDGKGIDLDRFEEGVQYQATIQLKAEDGWTFVKGYPFAYPQGSVESQQDLTAVVSETMRVVSVAYKATKAPRAVTDLDLSNHISAPVTGATAMRSVLGKENQYTGSAYWEVQTLGDDPAQWETMTGVMFEPERTYRAVVTLYAGPGYTLKGAEFTHTGEGSECSNPGTGVGHVLEGLIITFPATKNAPVTDMKLTDKVPQPVTGGTPVTYFSAPQYTGNVAWSVTSSPGGPPIGLFEAGTAYTATVTLTAAPGYTFAGNAVSSLSSAPSWAVSRTVGNAVNSSFEHEGGKVEAGSGSDTAVVIITFSSTESAAGSGEAGTAVVTDLDLAQYLSAPVRGGTPAPTFSGPQYSGTVAWKKTGESAAHSGLFGAGTAYTATVALTANQGRTFAGVKANAFSHDGKDTKVTPNPSNPEGSGLTITVTIDFEATKPGTGWPWEWAEEE